MYDALLSICDWTEENVQAALTELIASLGVKNGIVFWPARIAISGKESTPGGPSELAGLLGKEETLRRLQFSMRLLENA